MQAEEKEPAEPVTLVLSRGCVSLADHMSSRLKSARYILWPHTGFVLAVGVAARRLGLGHGETRRHRPDDRRQTRGAASRMRAVMRAVARGFVALEVYAWLRFTLITVEYRRYRRGPRAASQGALGSNSAVHRTRHLDRRHARAYASGNRICFRQRRPSERWSLKLVSPLLLLLALRPLVRVGRGRTTFNTCESLGHFFQLVLVGLMLLPNALERVTGRGQLL